MNSAAALLRLPFAMPFAPVWLQRGKVSPRLSLSAQPRPRHRRRIGNTHTGTACVRQLEDMAYAAVNEAADLGTQTRWGADHNAGAMPEVLMAMIEENVRGRTLRATSSLGTAAGRGCC